MTQLMEAYKVQEMTMDSSPRNIIVLVPYIIYLRFRSANL